MFTFFPKLHRSVKDDQVCFYNRKKGDIPVLAWHEDWRRAIPCRVSSIRMRGTWIRELARKEWQASAIVGYQQMSSSNVLTYPSSNLQQSWNWRMNESFHHWLPPRLTLTSFSTSMILSESAHPRPHRPIVYSLKGSMRVNILSREKIQQNLLGCWKNTGEFMVYAIFNLPFQR